MGTVVGRKIDKRGGRMAFLTLEDMEGSTRVIVFARTFEKYAQKLRKDAIVIITGAVDTGREQATIKADDIMTIEEARKRLTRTVHIKLITTGLEDQALESLKQRLAAFKGDCSVVIHFMSSPGEETAVMETPVKVAPTEALIADLEGFLGEDSVWFGT